MSFSITETVFPGVSINTLKCFYNAENKCNKITQGNKLAMLHCKTGSIHFMAYDNNLLRLLDLEIPDFKYQFFKI